MDRRPYARDLTTQISRLLVASLVATTVMILGSLYWFSTAHNALWKTGSQQQVRQAVTGLNRQLSALTKDYAWWDDAVTEIKNDNEAWIRSNMGAAVTETESADLMWIGGPITRDFFWIMETDGPTEQKSLPETIKADILATADRLKLVPVEPEVKLVDIDNRPFILAIARITPSSSVESVDPATLPVLVIGYEISDARVAAVGENLLLDDIHLSKSVNSSDEFFPITASNGDTLTNVVWQQRRPGDVILGQLMLPTALALLLFVACAWLAARHLSQTASRLAGALQAAEGANKAKTEFLSNISHELRTPLNSILGFIEVLAGTPLAERQISLLKMVRQSGKSMLQMVTDLLDFAKIEHGTLTINPQPFSLRNCVSRVVNNFQASARDKGIDLVLVTHPHTPELLEGDALRIEQIVSNLVSNAVKFTEKGFVQITVMPSFLHDFDGICIQVQDTGVGIPSDQHAAIFERFNQIDNSTTRKNDGCGIGLSIVKSLVDLSGGQVSVASSLGSGSTFTVLLPLPTVVQSTELQRGEAGTASVPLTSSPKSGSENNRIGDLAASGAANGRVLVAENNAMNIAYIRTLLEMKEIATEIVEDGMAAVSAFTQLKPKLVLMDLAMPKMDGYEATKQIRQYEAEIGATRTPIVALTAAGAAEDRQHCRDAGFDDFVLKPILPEQMDALLDRWLKRTEPAQANLVA